jgi:hypothetical protein
VNGCKRWRRSPAIVASKKIFSCWSAFRWNDGVKRQDKAREYFDEVRLHDLLEKKRLSRQSR